MDPSDACTEALRMNWYSASQSKVYQCITYICVLLLANIGAQGTYRDPGCPDSPELTHIQMLLRTLS